jgi:hypothetical protein
MQFMLGSFYLFLIAGYDVFPVLYDWSLNFSVILLSFELAIIVNGGFNAIGIFVHWVRTGSGFRPSVN